MESCSRSEQTLSASDSIMASALLAFSRNNIDESKASKVRDDGNVHTVDVGSNITQHSTTAPKHCETDGASINRLISTSAHIQPIEPHAAQLAHLRAELLQDQVNAIAMYTGGFFNSPISFAGPDFHNSIPESSSEQTLIRQKEIEKALHSKPQRGRKRANLNEVERLELTRTRNREHAKSTRIRKKMRYEELLDCESRIKELEAKQDLEHRRRHCVVTFLDYRQQMLHEHTLSKIESVLPLKLMCLFQDNTNVRYDDGCFHTDNFPTLQRMQRFDDALLSDIVDDRKSLLYKTKNSSGLNCVAMTQSGTALVEVDLVQTIGSNMDNILKSFLWKITFEPKSDKIRSVSILNVTTGCSREMLGITNVDLPNAKEKGQQNLVEQISHPSVVSLDVEKDSRRSVNEVPADERRCTSDDSIGVSFF